MHEFSICTSLINIINSEIKNIFLKSNYNEKNTSIKKINIKIGSLRQVIPEYLKFAYRTLTIDSYLFGSELNIDIIPLKISCNNCGYTGEIPFNKYVCVKCNSISIDITNGKELFIESIEIEENN
ncbi:MAG: hydrogenase maturation nickel metallochaperone HypA [candidate division FCPU426 bacterium]